MSDVTPDTTDASSSISVVSGDDDDDDEIQMDDEISYIESGSEDDAVKAPKFIDSDASAAAVEEASAMGTVASGRLRVFEELVASEETYVAGLRIINDVYAKAFVQGSGADPALTILFNNATHIYTLNSGFLAELQQRLQVWKGGAVGDPRAATFTDVLGEYIPLFWFYSRFSVNLGAALAILHSYKRMEEGSALRQLVDRCERDPRCSGAPLDSLLIMPIQRIPRYILLMTELAKHSDQSDPDVGRIQALIKSLGSVTSGLNESVRRREGMESLIQLQKTLGKKVDLVAMDRRLLLDGVLSKVDRTGQAVRLHWHLFNDQIMFSRVSPLGGMYKHRFLDMRTLTVEYTTGGYSFDHAFMIKSPRKSFVVFGDTELITKKWFNAIAAAHQAYADDSAGDIATAPMRSPKLSHAECDLCHVAFSMRIRRHCCRICGSIVCSSCSGDRVLIPTIHPTVKQRACSVCTGRLHQETETTDDDDTKKSIPMRSVIGSWTNSVKHIIRRTRSSPPSTDLNSSFTPNSSLTASSSLLISPATSLNVSRTSLMSQFSSRREVADELLRTEVSFVDDLRITLDVLVNPLVAQLRLANTFDKFDGELIGGFEALEMIHTLAMTAISDLTSAIDTWTDDTVIGDIFDRRAKLFNLFAEYASHISRKSRLDADAEARIVALEADPRCLGIRFDRRLLRPLQRLSAYKFLLSKFLLLTPQDHADYPKIQGAIEQIAVASKLVSTAMKAGGNRAKIQEVEAQFHGKLVLGDHQELVRTGKVSVFDVGVPFSASAPPKLTPMSIHLFKGRIILSRGDDKRGYRIEHDIVPVPGSWLELDTDAEHVLEAAAPLESGRYSVARLHLARSALGLVAREATQKRSWFNDIQWNICSNATR